MRGSRLTCLRSYGIDGVVDLRDLLRPFAPGHVFGYDRCMNDRRLTYRDYVQFSTQPLDELLRDCEVSAFRATGPGGQGVNTTDSAVRMKHIPTGIAVTSRESRSQFRNRQLCLQKLQEILVYRALPPKTRKKTQIPLRVKEKRLHDKRIISRKKADRKRID